jgi:hypothetical protein
MTPIATRCYQLPESDPPVCGVHGRKLVRDTVPIDGKKIDCWRCPATLQVLK